MHCLQLDWYLGFQTEGNTYLYFAASPFPLQGKTNACSRGSKKDFWRRCRGDLRQVKTYQVPIINSSPSHYIICHSPLVFLSPTSKTIFENLCLFFAPLPFVSFRLLLVCLCVGLFVTMAHDNTKLCDFSNTNNNDFLSTPIAPLTDAESCEINTALLNLVMKDTFFGLLVKMPLPI